jgi:hypothetical protein
MLERAQVLRGDARADVGERTVCAPALAARWPRFARCITGMSASRAERCERVRAPISELCAARIDNVACNVAIAAANVARDVTH